MATNKKNKFGFNTKTVKQSISDGLNTSFTVGKILGIGGASTYLVITGMQQINPVFIALGAILSAYAIVNLVSTAHTATKSARA